MKHTASQTDLKMKIENLLHRLLEEFTSSCTCHNTSKSMIVPSCLRPPPLANEPASWPCLVHADPPLPSLGAVHSRFVFVFVVVLVCLSIVIELAGILNKLMLKNVIFAKSV